MSDCNHRTNNDLISEFPHPSQMKHIQYEKANNKINNLINYLKQNNYCDEKTSQEIGRQMKLVVSDLYKSLDCPDFIDQTDDEMISSIQDMAECYIPADVIKSAYISNMMRQTLGVLESEEISTVRGAAFAQKMLVNLLPFVDSMLTDKNVDDITVREKVSRCFEEDKLFIPADAKIDKLGYKINGVKTDTPNFVMQKFEKGDCQARYINDNSKPCKHKTENGKICCSKHQPLSQEDKRIIHENKSGTFSSNESEIAQSESSNNEIHINNTNKCKYIKDRSQCKNAAYVGGFCKECYIAQSDESQIHKSNDYCIIITTRGINKDRVCGKKSYEEGVHICEDHYWKITEEDKPRCDYVNKGKKCGAKVNNPNSKRCKRHLNHVTQIYYEPEPKGENVLEYEEELEEKAKEKIEYCELRCGNGNPCRREADGYVDVINGKTKVEKLACPMHARINDKKNMESKKHRCLAKCKTTGKQCQNKNVPEEFLYCDRHEAYDPTDQCGAFDLKTNDRCLKECENGEDFCKGHKHYKEHKIDPIEDEADVYIIRGQLMMQEFYNFTSQYTVVCVDPPKKLLKLNILSDEEVNKLKQSKLTYIPSKIEGEGHGLDFYLSDSEEESACTEEEEKSEIVKPEVTIPKRCIIPEEFELVNNATGWTEEQIKTMKNKLIYKRVLGAKNKFDLEKSLFETRKNLEQYFTTAINKTNSKYEGCKRQLENLIRATHFDLEASVENVIGLFGVQRIFSRDSLLENCKDSLRDLRNLKKDHEKRLKGLPIPIIKKKLVEMDTQKYMNAFNDAINTVKKESKEDSKYLKEFQLFMSGPYKPQKYTDAAENARIKKRDEFNTKYKAYFEKYIVRFAKVSLHKENCKGRMFGFANYFIDLLKGKTLDYTKFRNAYGGELRNENGIKSFYCDMFTIITGIIEDHKDDKDNKIMNYLDVDISTNLSNSEHQTEFSQELQECKRTGKTRRTAKSMLDVGIVERFNAKEGCYDYNQWISTEESTKEFTRGIPDYHGNLLTINAKEFNYPDYDFSRTTAPQIPRMFNDGRFNIPEEIKGNIKPSYENNVQEILGIII